MSLTNSRGPCLTIYSQRRRHNDHESSDRTDTKQGHSACEQGNQMFCVVVVIDEKGGLRLEKIPYWRPLVRVMYFFARNIELHAFSYNCF